LTHSSSAIIDILKNITSGNNDKQPVEGQQQMQEGQSSGGGGFMDKLNGYAGGGAQGEKNEDGLDKGTTYSNSHTYSWK
jgi:hypothetical protein